MPCPSDPANGGSRPSQRPRRLTSAGSRVAWRRCARGRAMKSWTGPVARCPWWRRARSPIPAGRPLVAGPAATSSHGLFTNRGRGIPRIPPGGAAGSRTRVPRPRCSGLYVRRSRMISDHGAPRPDSSVVLAALRCSPRPGGMGLGVEPRHVDSTLVRGVRGESSRSLCREYHLVVVGTYGFRRFLSRSRRHPRHAPLAAEWPRSKPCQPQVLLVRIDALQFSRMARGGACCAKKRVTPPGDRVCPQSSHRAVAALTTDEGSLRRGADA
jgi:hypothetical protein